MAEERLNSVEKAIRILKLIRKSGPRLGVTELAKMLEVDKASIHRLLNTLKKEYLVLQDDITKKYTLGPAILWLAEGLRSDPLLQELTKHLNSIRNFTGETVSIYHPLGLFRVAVATAESNQVIRNVLPVGTIFSIHTGTTGKVMLANMPESEREDILRRLVGEGTVKLEDLQDICEKIEEARRTGYYFAVADREKDLAAVSLPLTAPNGLYGVVSISGPVVRWNNKTIQHYLAGIEAEVQKMQQIINERS